MEYGEFLQHHGILGMKWGIRRFQNRDGTYTPEGLSRKRLNHVSYKQKNLDKWGSDEEHNSLFIGGFSGSGKTTVAKRIAKPNDKVISLDYYSDKVNESDRNKDFDRFLDREVPGWRALRDATDTGENGTLKRFSAEYWDKEVEFQEALDRYSRQEYKKGNRVIVEGVQILDNWFAEDDKYYEDKPLVVLSTSLSRSRKQQIARDGSGMTFNSEKEYREWRNTVTTTMKEFLTNTKVEQGKDFVKQWIKEKEE